MTALGGFRWVKESHSGETIATRFVDVLEELDILDRIGGITMDNASNNNTSMDHFERLLNDRGIKYDAIQQCIRCFSHIIHLAAEAGLAALPKPELFDITTIEDPSISAAWITGQQDTAYTRALQSDTVSRIQELVRQLRTNGRRRDALQRSIEVGNNAGIFEEPIPQLQLIRRVVTRWSSCFRMLDRWLHLTPAINLLLGSPNVTGLTTHETLTVQQNVVVNDIRGLYAYFNIVQESLACEKTPTLPFVLPLFKDLMDMLWDICAKDYPKLVHVIQASFNKLKKYKDECRRSNLYTLAMGTCSRFISITIY